MQYSNARGQLSSHFQFSTHPKNLLLSPKVGFLACGGVQRREKGEEFPNIFWHSSGCQIDTCRTINMGGNTHTNILQADI